MWPILQCENVFVLPGVPQFFEQKLGTICDHFLTKRQIYMSKIAIAVEEVGVCVCVRTTPFANQYEAG